MEEFSIEVTKRAIAKASIALDFKFASSSTLEIMADIVHHYIMSIGTHTREQAEIAGRSQPGIHDALAALEQARPYSTSWKECRDFAFEDVKNPSLVSDKKWCEPFPFVVPSFPVRQKSRQSPTASSDVLTSRSPHVPPHLPPFPPEHTFKRTPKKRALASESEAVETGTSQQLRIKRIAATKSIQKSLSKLEAVELHGALPRITSEKNVGFEQPTNSSDGVWGQLVSPALEVGSRDVDPVKSSIDIPIEVRRSLAKEQKLLLGIPPETSTTNL